MDVALKKENYGEPGTSDYRKNMAMATQALTEKFGVARHKIVADAEEGDVSKNLHVQQVVVTTLHRIKEGHLRSKKMDWMDICTLADYSGQIDHEDCSKWWGSLEIFIWTDWELLTETHVRAWQFSVNKRFSDEDRIASTWLKEFVYNSSTDSLRSVVDKKYDRLPASQRGGIMYLYFTLCEMFQMSREVKDAMLNFLDLFKRKGVARYTGENVLLVSEEIIGVCKRLDSVGALQEDHVIDILTGLSICGNSCFRSMFELLRQSADLGNMNFLDTIDPLDSPMDKLEAVLEKAVDVYDKLCTAQLWIKPGRGGGNALNSIVQAVSVCWNCGESGHRVGECKKPRDQKTIDKNKKAFMEAKKNSSNNNNSDQGKKPSKSSPEYQRKVWEAAGIQSVNGTLMVQCKTCGLNSTHSTKFHSAWQSNPTSFKLPASHPYSRALSNIKPPVQPPSQPPTQSPGQGSGGGSGMISWKRADLEAKLSSFERNSTDPNASCVSEAIRALLLN